VREEKKEKHRQTDTQTERKMERSAHVSKTERESFRNFEVGLHAFLKAHRLKFKRGGGGAGTGGRGRRDGYPQVHAAFH
jgi:hypothetical protein